MGYYTDRYIGYGVNLGGVFSGGYEPKGEIFASGSFARKSEEDVEAIIEADYPSLCIEGAGDSRVEYVAIIAVRSTVKGVESGALDVANSSAPVDPEGASQLDAFVERFGVKTAPAWISWESIT